MMYMTPKQLADRLEITPQCVTMWCRAGYLGNDARLVEGRWMILDTPFLALPARPRGKDGKLPPPRTHKRGRPPGAPNKKPYPKGVKKPRKKLED